MVEKQNRVNNYDKRMQESILDNTIMVETSGKAVGQINGLSVLDLGDCMFGKPSKITANTFIGKSGIVNIEREADMSGTSHTKGVLILSAYIGEKYAQDLPLALTASLCFEQLYGGVDGDSASSTEVYAILSSLYDVPITVKDGATLNVINATIDYVNITAGHYLPAIIVEGKGSIAQGLNVNGMVIYTILYQPTTDYIQYMKRHHHHFYKLFLK